jgi:hypothetical protein
MSTKDLFNKEGVYECIKDWYINNSEHPIFTKGKYYRLKNFNGTLCMQGNDGNCHRNWHFSQWLVEYREHFKYVGPYDYTKYGSMWYGYPEGIDDKSLV